MDSIMSIIYGLRRLCFKHSLNPENIKITVEFLKSEDESRAEYALRKEAQGVIFGHEMIDSICDGRDFTIMGFRFKVKKWQPPAIPDCGCKLCCERRDAMR